MCTVRVSLKAGIVQQYEELEAYKKRQIQERLTFEMLERYCRALGVEVNQVDFYGPRSCAVKMMGPEASWRLINVHRRAEPHLDL